MSTTSSIIRQARQRRQLTLQHVADATGRTLQHIRSIETGKLNGTPETLRRIAAVLGINEGVLHDAYIADAVDQAAYLWDRDCKGHGERGVGLS